MTWTYVTSDVNGEEIIETCSGKELETVNLK